MVMAVEKRPSALLHATYIYLVHIDVMKFPDQSDANVLDEAYWLAQDVLNVYVKLCKLCLQETCKICNNKKSRFGGFLQLSLQNEAF